MQPSLFLSSGDLIADRRYQRAKDYEAHGDLGAAADLLEQTVELVPGFASAWFALGELREGLSDRDGAVAAFSQALSIDQQDRQGSKLRLALLGHGAPAEAMSSGYVRALFDQYAPEFDRALTERLGYRAPQLLLNAVMATGKASGRVPRFNRTLDLGCGTGLAGGVFAPTTDVLIGVDLSPAMIEIARRKGCYQRLVLADMHAFIAEEADASAGVVIAADAFVYLSDLAPICREIARVLEWGGLFAFTVETHDGAGAVLGEKLRYAHCTEHVRTALAAADLKLHVLTPASTRREAGVPAPGLVVVADRQ